MSPRPMARSRARQSRVLALSALVVVVAVVLSACAAKFDPTGPCTEDGSAPGAYPELEALVPTTFRGGPPKLLDSGRTCTTDGLGTLAGHGITELRFAGATWETGNDSGISLALFTSQGGPPLSVDWLAEFYATGAAQGKNVTSVDPSDYPLDSGGTARRLDVLNGESFQTVVVWARDGRIAAALIGNFIRDIQTREAHDKVVAEAIAAWGG